MHKSLSRYPNNRFGGTARPPRWVLACLTAVVLSSGLFVAGCSDEDDEVVATVRKKRDEKKEQQAPQSTVANNEIGYVYNAQNKRDPFKSYFEELAVSEKEQRNLSELQRFELGSLKLVAVVAGTATPMALLEDLSKKAIPSRLERSSERNSVK